MFPAVWRFTSGRIFWWTDAKLGFVVVWYDGRKEEADPQERRRAGLLRQKAGACSAIGHGRFNPLGLLADKVVSNRGISSRWREDRLRDLKTLMLSRL